MKKKSVWWVRLFCKHEFQADTQITVVRCKLCGEQHRYKKGVNLFPNVWSYDTDKQ